MVTNKANKRPEGTQGHATRSRGFSSEKERNKAEKRPRVSSRWTLQSVLKKQSKLLVKQYTPKSDHYLGWDNAKQVGGLTLSSKLQNHSARVVTTALDLKEFFHAEHQLPKLSVQPDTTGFQSVCFVGQEDVIHLMPPS
ncbi:hypothetical protein NDA10_000770 [Ustilago hordei]|nr:hypothetical protein NDA10_000770 [Ustilago hordei]UTT89202.1 hypothetical protein NDA17_002379 [Ustilago hordei]